MNARVIQSVLAVAIAAALPLVTQDQYVLRVAIFAGLFVVMAVTYDLVVGQTGSLSLAHPTFYGIGAYTVAILVTSYQVPFPLAFLAAALIAFASAILIGIPCFRLSEHSFAIGTLGFSIVLQLVANNWIDLTNGPMCTAGVPALEFSFLGKTFSTAQVDHAYYGVLVLAVVITAIVWIITSSRVGRAFRAIRENTVLARSQGVNATLYKLAAFGISAALVSVAGGYYASYSSLVCPTEMGYPYTVALLIIVYLGGVGSLRGVILAAILFTLLPEVLRVTQEARLVLYGILLLLVSLYLPQGMEGAVARLEQHIAKLWRRAFS
ncbi:MAG: branched-chain amino acid ABC transporter permease [Parvibaculaceae bacterium]